MGIGPLPQVTRREGSLLCPLRGIVRRDKKKTRGKNAKQTPGGGAERSFPKNKAASASVHRNRRNARLEQLFQAGGKALDVFAAAIIFCRVTAAMSLD